MPAIHINKLKTIIREELESLKSDAPNPKDIGVSPAASQSEKVKASADVLNNVVVLLKAIETFEDKASSTLKDKLSEKISQLKTDLTNISKFPDEYIGGKTSPAVSPSTLMKPQQKKVIKPTVSSK